MANIDIYYESLKQVHNQILEWDNRPTPFREKLSSWLIAIAGIVVTLSLIPIFPSIFVFVGGQRGWVIGSVDLSQATIQTYGIAWLIASVVSLLIFFVILYISMEKLSIPFEDSQPPQTLSPEQVTFIFIYEASKELKVYFVSHIDEHVNNCINVLSQINTYAYDSVFIDQRIARKNLSPHEFDMIYRGERVGTRSGRIRSSLPRQISVSREFLQIFEKYPWLNLDDVTKSRLHALISFRIKILNRLQRREDIPSVLNILDNFSKFTYAFLPEHQTNMDSEALEELQAEGTKNFDVFVQEVMKLTDIPESPRIGHPFKKSQKTRWHKLRTFYFYNVFFRFALWFIILFILSSSLVFIASLRFQQLDINVMVSLIIGTTIAGAAGLAAYGAKSSESKQDSESSTTDSIKKSN